MAIVLSCVAIGGVLNATELVRSSIVNVSKQHGVKKLVFAFQPRSSHSCPPRTSPFLLTMNDTIHHVIRPVLSCSSLDGCPHFVCLVAMHIQVSCSPSEKQDPLDINGLGGCLCLLPLARGSSLIPTSIRPSLHSPLLLSVMVMAPPCHHRENPQPDALHDLFEFAMVSRGLSKFCSRKDIARLPVDQSEKDAHNPTINSSVVDTVSGPCF